MHRLATALLICGFGFTTTFSQVIPGRWEKLDSEGVGKRVQITLNSQDQIEGILQASTDAELEIRARKGRLMRVRKADVQSVTRRVRKADSLTNGVLIGGLAGLGLGVWFAAPDDNSNKAIPIFAGVGALFGVLIDGTVNRRRAAELLYVRAAGKSNKAVGR